jgi:cytoskeletal protein CcmA (bactofilin family)
MRTASGLTIKGDLTATEDVTVDFALEGLIDIPGHRLLVAEGGHVQATVKAKSVVVQGRLDGHIAADRVELSPTALVGGTVVTPHLLLHDGAQMTAVVNTERAQAAGSVARHRQKTNGET